MSATARLTIIMPSGKQLTVYGTRRGEVVKAEAAIESDWRGNVLILGKKGKVYCANLSGRRIYRAHESEHILNIVECMVKLGLVDAGEHKAAWQKHNDVYRKAEIAGLVRDIRRNASALGIEIPDEMLRKMEAAE